MLWLKTFSQISLGIIIIISGGIAGIYYAWKYDNGQSIKDVIARAGKAKKRLYRRR